MILNTDKKEFLTELLRDANRSRLQAIAEWVRHGGRLVVPVNYANQDLLAPLLGVARLATARSRGAARTVLAISRQPPSNGSLPIELWTNTPKPFPAPGEKPVAIAKLSPAPVAAGIWDVQAKTDDGRPLIARMPYGRGSITYLAFSLDEAAVQCAGMAASSFSSNWSTASRRSSSVSDRNQTASGGWRDSAGKMDITTSLQEALDNFDVNVIPFGYVALFIILYILIVGPLDYFILKHVFAPP